MGALIIELSGKVVRTNFDVYKEKLIGRIRIADKLLEREDDYDHAETHVTFFKRAEDALKKARQSAIDQIDGFRILFSAIEEVIRETRQVRGSLERQIKKRKSEARERLVQRELKTLEKAIDQVPIAEHEVEFRAQARREFLVRDKFDSRIRGRTLHGAQAELERVRKQQLAILQRRHTEFEFNVRRLARLEPAERCLFQDHQSLLALPPDQLENVIRYRLLELERVRPLTTLRQSKPSHSPEARLTVHVETSAQKLPEIEREITKHIESLGCRYRIERDSRPGSRDGGMVA